MSFATHKNSFSHLMICGHAKQKHNSPSHKTKKRKNWWTEWRKKGKRQKSLISHLKCFQATTTETMNLKCSHVRCRQIFVSSLVRIIFHPLSLNSFDIFRIDSHMANQITIHAYLSDRWVRFSCSHRKKKGKCFLLLLQKHVILDDICPTPNPHTHLCN